MTVLLGGVGGGLAGAAAGLLAALAVRALRTARNRARVVRGLSPVKDEVLPRLMELGAFAGALLGAALTLLLPLPQAIVLGALALPSVVLVATAAGELVFGLRRRVDGR